MTKYESDGGPGLSDLAGLLKGSIQAAKDLTTQLTPLYDVMSIWPVEGNGPSQFSMFKAKMAMAVLGKNKHYLFNDIQRRHFNNMASKCFDRVDAEEVIVRVLQAAPRAIEAMRSRLPEGFPSQIAESVFKGLRQYAELLERMPTS